MRHPLEWAATHLKKPGYFCALQIISVTLLRIPLAMAVVERFCTSDFALGSRSRAIEWRYRGRSLGGGGYWYASHDHAWRHWKSFTAQMAPIGGRSILILAKQKI